MKQEISAGVIVYQRSREGPKFLILYHGHSYWNFPKGKIESEEKSLAAALRETREETGLSGADLRLIQEFKAHQRFSFKREGQTIFKVVIFYLAETRKTEIRLASSEHEGYAWFLFREAMQILRRHPESQRILRSAYDFIRNKSSRSRQANSPR